MTDEVSPEAFFETLAGSTTYPDGLEGRRMRYHDFRAVFLATEQGHRVLHEILRQCGVNKATPPAGRIDPYLTHIKDGRRGAGLTIMGILNDEPKPQPTAANRQKES